MTPRERVIAALTHREGDKIPWTTDLTQVEREKLVAFTGNPEIVGTFQSHIAAVNIGTMEPCAGRPDHWVDHFGVVWNRTVDKDIGIVAEHRIPEADVAQIAPCIPPVDGAFNGRAFERLMALPGEPFRVANLGFSLFERAWTLRGMDNLLMDMVEAPEFVDALLDAITDWNIAAVRRALAYPIDGVLFGDDWGMQHGLIMGPRMWRRFLKPRLARMYAAAHEGGRFVLQHSCGDIHEVYPDLVEIGLNAHQTFQPEIYDIEAIKAQYAGKLAFWGGISTQRLLPFATPDEVRSETRRIMGIMGRGGGFIAAPTHAVPPDAPAENVLAMVEVFQSQPL